MKASLILFLAAFALPAFSKTPQVQLSADLAHPSVPAEKKLTTYLKVGLTGFELETAAKRAPVNVAIVIDKSGSMGGDKIIHARESAKQALDRLGPGDTVSVIAYDDTVHVIAPASGLSEREAVKAAIDRIVASGSTALFAGVSKASEEIRKNKTPNQVNRIVLLSDGMANIGPSSPQELGRLGTALAKEGITVTTLGLGLGYNEDLMTELALRSDGNHAFIQDSDALVDVFQREFGDILSVVAQGITIQIQCAENVRPVRVLGREAEIRGQNVTLGMNQLYARQNKYILLEVELSEGAKDTDVAVAEVKVNYLNAVTGTEDKLATRSVARCVQDAVLVSTSMNKEVMVEVAKFIATEKEAIAVKLSDEGKREEAMVAFAAASSWAVEQGKKWNAPELEKLGESQLKRQKMFEEGGDRANTARKMSKDEQFKNTTQNTGVYSPDSKSSGVLKILPKK